MKKTLLLLLLFLTAAVRLPGSPLKFVDARQLTLGGKLMPTPANPYHRVDTALYKGFTRGELEEVLQPTGLTVFFRTNSSRVDVRAVYNSMSNGVTSGGISQRGFDLYIREGGRWQYARANVGKVGKEGNRVAIITGMDRTDHECMLYLPLRSELASLEIGVDADASIEAIPSPMRHRIAIFGSSFTQGAGTSRPGMLYSSQFMRMTGYDILNLGCSGNAKLQPYFAEVLAGSDVEAILVDGFSNSLAGVIRERLLPFIGIIRAKQPDTPIIFLSTIYRESRHFSRSVDKVEREKREAVEEMMALAQKQFRHVYFVEVNASDPDRETSVDGTHPSDWGYRLWAESMVRPVRKILSRYGIK